MADNKILERSGERVFTSAGALATSCKMYVYLAGTTNNASIYSDKELTAALANPVTADANGLLPYVYTGTAAYKTRLETSAGVVIDEEDNIPGALDTSSLTATFAKPDTDVAVKTTTYTMVAADLGTVITGNTTGGGFTITLMSAATATNGRGITIKHTGTANTLTIARAGSDTIDGATSVALTTQYNAVELVSDGANWHIVSRAWPGFDSLSPTTTRGDLIMRGASSNARLAIGASATLLHSDGTDAVWVAGSVFAAAQSDQETGTSTVLFVTPGRQQFHASAAKAWGSFTFAAGINASYNITSLTDVGTGQIGVTIATDFSSATWSAQAMGSGTTDVSITQSSKAAGSVQLNCFSQAGTVADVSECDFSAFGDHA